jgi:hypothetical protein
MTKSVDEFKAGISRLVDDYHVPGNIVNKLLDDLDAILDCSYTLGRSCGIETAKNRLEQALNDRLSLLLGE